MVIPASQAESDEQVASQVLSQDLSQANSSASVYGVVDKIRLPEQEDY